MIVWCIIAAGILFETNMYNLCAAGWAIMAGRVSLNLVGLHKYLCARHIFDSVEKYDIKVKFCNSQLLVV